ncbi:MAG TPA: hypothetical protein VKA70_11645 [Blastocatellia bacterium]|nr:hypothetical protein [Blastocatellia bacterium]
MATTRLSGTLVLVSKQNGIVIIQEETPLTRLNYFDGKFLRASDLKAEQDYLRQLIRQSNRAGGPGIAHGFDLTQGAGDTIEIGPGLAIDPDGRVLLLSQETTINVQELIDKSRELMTSLGLRMAVGSSFGDCELVSETPPINAQQPSDLYLITISHAEALCGEEDVFGKLCEEACVTSTDRPFIVEGLIVRAIPLVLQTALPHSKAVSLSRTHLRSRVASAFFEDERQVIAHLISKTNLGLQTWCLGADAASGNGVAIGVLARAGSTTVFLDPWIARRELIDTPARRYWQWRMMMRPWDVFLAQVLQFQCQLHDLFRNLPQPGGDTDPCQGAGVVIGEAAQAIAELQVYYEAATKRFTQLGERAIGGDAADLTFQGGLTRLANLNNNLIQVQQNLSAVIQDRLLIRGGLVGVPSAGYLPIALDSGMTVNQQVRQMMGEGVDLRFCVVRPDYVAHALEEAQHMERISLIEGLDDPTKKPEVDILVPDGEIIEQRNAVPGISFEASVDVDRLFGRKTVDRSVNNLDTPAVRFRGAARAERLVSGGGAVYLSVDYQPEFTVFQPNPTAVVSGIDTVERVKATESAARVSRPQASAGDRGRDEQISITPSNLIPTDVGLWIGLRCERNVFTLRNGDTTNVNAQAILGPRPAPVEGQVKRPLFYVELNGLFEITQAANQSSSRVIIKGRFNNALFTHQTPESSDPTRPNTMIVDLDATITLTNNNEIEVLIEHTSFNTKLSVAWGSQPLNVRAAIAIVPRLTGRTGPESRLVDAVLKENADVILDQNPDHVLALQGLEAAASSLNNLGFADAKSKLLFPPPTQVTDELVVRAKRDWVLFHRRRAKQCSQEKIVPPPLPSRHYNVYHALVTSAAEAARLKEGLISGNLQESVLTKLPAVEFAGGAPTLLTDAQGFRGDWQSINPGNLLISGLIASIDTAAVDGNALALARLGRLEAAVSSISAPAPSATNEVLLRVPNQISVVGTDGAIFLFTMRQVTTICNSVFRVREGEMERVKGFLASSNLGTAIGQFTQRAGNVTFVGGVPDNSLQTFATKWASLADGVPRETLVITSSLDTTITEEVATSQATAIKQVITPAGGTSPAATYQQYKGPFDPALDVCPVITFIEPNPAVRQLTAVIVYASLETPGMHVLNRNTLRTTAVFVNNVPQGQEWENFARTFSANLPIRGASYGALGTITTGDQGPINRVNAVIVGLGRSPTLVRGVNVDRLSEVDKNNLTALGFLSSTADEVIFLEPN